MEISRERGEKIAKSQPALSVHMTGLEPARPFGHSDLNAARIPTPPHVQIAHRGRIGKACEPEDLEGFPTRSSFVR